MSERRSGWNKQFVWPRDSRKGQVSPGIFQRLKDAVRSRGPDVFIQEKNSRMPIKIDEWSNWDSYHSRDSRNLENDPKLPRYCRRGKQRYDPQTRRYVRWHTRDMNGSRLFAPTMTKEEVRESPKNRERIQGPENTRVGEISKRFGPEFGWFWKEAHRAGGNKARGRHPYDDVPNWGQDNQNLPRVYAIQSGWNNGITYILPGLEFAPRCQTQQPGDFEEFPDAEVLNFAPQNHT